MSLSLRNQDIRIKVIRLKRSFDLQINPNKLNQQKKVTRQNLTALKPYQFPDFDQSQFQKNDQTYSGFLPHNHKSYDKNYSLEQNQPTPKSSISRKLPDLSYKTQKNQRFNKQQLAIEDLKHIRSISIHSFLSTIQNPRKIKTEPIETFQKYHHKISKTEHKQKIQLNVVPYVKIKHQYAKGPRAKSIKQTKKYKMQNQQTKKESNSYGKILLTQFEAISKRQTPKKQKQKKFEIDAWNVTEQFII